VDSSNINPARLAGGVIDHIDVTINNMTPQPTPTPTPTSTPTPVSTSQPTPGPTPTPSPAPTNSDLVLTLPGAPDGGQVNPGQLVTFQAQATDPIPGRTLTYSLDPGAPAGASIDPKTGVFTWVAYDQVVGPVQSGPLSAHQIQDIVVRVTDDGSPPLTQTADFLLAVNPQPAQSPGGGKLHHSHNKQASPAHPHPHSAPHARTQPHLAGIHTGSRKRN
jgi:hypothetical protein